MNNSGNSHVITEITPLSDKDFFYLVDRKKDRFNYPIHRHDEYELNFVSGCAGAMRIVGDSMVEIGDYDLVLVGNGIEHAWEQNKCIEGNIHEITIQFSRNLFGDVFLGKNQMRDIRNMLEKSADGIAFSQLCVMRVYSRLERLSRLEGGFERVIEFLTILHELATSGDYKILSNSSYANSCTPHADSRRVLKVQQYINVHYREEIRLSDLAALVGMTSTAFSRFFKLRTGRPVSDFITDIRLGIATRALVDSTQSVSEICYDCGFNNVSYFNRIFKKKKGCAPKQFREYYRRNRVLV